MSLMFGLRIFVHRLWRRFGPGPRPIAEYIETHDGRVTRFELYPRGVLRQRLKPRDHDLDGITFLAAIDPDVESVKEYVGVKDVTGERAMSFITAVIDAIHVVQELGIPPDAPLAEPGINEFLFKKGQRLRTARKIPVHVNVHFAGPFSDGYARRLPPGVILQVTDDSVDFATATHCDIIEPDYSRLETQLVKSPDMEHELYDGYSVTVESARLAEDCERLAQE